MSEQNQYQTPSSNLEQTGSEDYGTISWSSASGRLGRIRYIGFSLLVGVVFMVIVGILSMIFGAGMAVMGMGAGGAGAGLSDGAATGMGIGAVLFWLFLVVAYIVLLVVSIRLSMQRLHDFNVSGWFLILYFIPLVGFFFALALLFYPGTDGENRFGKKTPPNNSAVTIIVILFAVFMSIAMIGVLSAIAIPAYQGYVEQAKQLQLEQAR